MAKKEYPKIDKTLETAEARKAEVERVLAEIDPDLLTPRYLSFLSDYIIYPVTKKDKMEERRKKELLTPNRMITVNDRETSFQGLISKFENGEDGIYNLITNDKNVIYKHNIKITEKDVAEIPALKSLRDAIEVVEKDITAAKGKDRAILRACLIDMRKDQYAIRNEFKKPMYCQNIIRSIAQLDLTDNITIENMEPINSNALVNMFDPKHVSSILCNYSELKEYCWGKFTSDAYYFMMDFDKVADAALKDYPVYDLIVTLKIDGKQNAEIQKEILDTYDTSYSIEYISMLWRNKIPKLIAETAKEQYLNWYYTFKEVGKWKRCSRCKKIKLAHNRYFSLNRAAKDGFYSMCKECRNKKKGV